MLNLAVGLARLGLNLPHIYVSLSVYIIVNLYTLVWRFPKEHDLPFAVECSIICADINNRRQLFDFNFT